MATPGSFLRGDSPSPAPYRQHGTWVLRSGSAPQRTRAGVAWGLVEERGNDLMGGAVAAGGPALPVPARNSHTCLGPLLCALPTTLSYPPAGHPPSP